MPDLAVLQGIPTPEKFKELMGDRKYLACGKAFHIRLLEIGERGHNWGRNPVLGYPLYIGSSVETYEYLYVRLLRMQRKPELRGHQMYLATICNVQEDLYYTTALGFDLKHNPYEYNPNFARLSYKSYPELAREFRYEEPIEN